MKARELENLTVADLTKAQMAKVAKLVTDRQNASERAIAAEQEKKKVTAELASLLGDGRCHVPIPCPPDDKGRDRVWIWASEPGTAISWREDVLRAELVALGWKPGAINSLLHKVKQVSEYNKYTLRPVVVE